MGPNMCPELIELMLVVQRTFDAERDQLENNLLHPTDCECPQCWSWYWSRWNELRFRDQNMQDFVDDLGVQEDIRAYAPEVELSESE